MATKDKEARVALDAELQRLKKQIIESRDKRLKSFKRNQRMNAITYELHGAVNLFLVIMAVNNSHWYTWLLAGLFIVLNIVLVRADMQMDRWRYTNETELAHLEGALLYSADIVKEAEEHKEKTDGKQAKRNKAKKA